MPIKLPKIKRRLTSYEEFDIMKLVLDKFLWIGSAFMGWGLYNSITGAPQDGFYLIVVGAIVTLLFGALIVREFEQLR